MSIWNSRVCQENRCKSSAGWTIMPHFLKLALIEKKMKNGQKNSTNVCYKFLWHTACSFMTFYRDPINHLTDPYKKKGPEEIYRYESNRIFFVKTFLEFTLNITSPFIRNWVSIANASLWISFFFLVTFSSDSFRVTPS